MVKKEAAKQDESLTGDDFEKYLKWRAYKLFMLGYKIQLCVLSLRKVYDFPSDTEVEKRLQDNLAALGERTSYLKGQVYDWLELVSAPQTPLTLNIISRTKSDVFSLMGGNYPKDLSFQEYCDRITEELKLIKNDTDASLRNIGHHCVNVGIMVGLEKEVSKEEYRIFFKTEFILRDKAQQAIGYWSGKLKEKKSGRENAMVRTTKKEQSKDKIKTWIAEGMKTAAVRLKAQKEFEVTDRTVLNWLKEIKEEKAPVLRKKDGVA